MGLERGRRAPARLNKLAARAQTTRAASNKTIASSGRAISAACVCNTRRKTTRLVTTDYLFYVCVCVCVRLRELVIQLQCVRVCVFACVRVRAGAKLIYDVARGSD